MKQPYNIVCVSDESYIQHTAVMLCSLFETNKNNIFHITTVQRNYPIGSVDLNRNHSSDVLV